MKELSQKYIDQLSILPDPISRLKIQKEIERFNQIDHHSPDYHKLLTYLDEVFSIPWEKSTVLQLTLYLSLSIGILVIQKVSWTIKYMDWKM
jgi:ATP-dependent Lon protease